MSVRIRELRQERAKLITESRAMLDKAEEEKRALRDEELTEDKKREERIAALASTIRAEEKQLEYEKEQARSADDDEPGNNPADTENRTEAETESMEIFRRFISGGERALSREEMNSRVLRPFGDRRAMQVDNPTQGGVIQAPAQWVNELIQGVTNIGNVRALARAFTVTTLAGIEAPYLESRGDEESDWTPELGAPTLDPGMQFGKRGLQPHQLKKEALLPMTLIQTALMPIEQMVREELERKNAVTEERHFLQGDGAQKPCGMMVASSAYGFIPTTYDVVCGGATDFTFDGLIDVKGSLNRKYRRNAKWLFHDNAIFKLRKLKDGEGRYIWDVSVKVGEPDVLLGAPIEISDFMYNTYTASQYVGLYGDFSKYWILDFNLVGLQVLNELYARTGQIGYISTRWLDGATVLPEAFRRLKMGS